jgi:hypothetical protein
MMVTVNTMERNYWFGNVRNSNTVASSALRRCGLISYHEPHPFKGKNVPQWNEDIDVPTWHWNLWEASWGYEPWPNEYPTPPYTIPPWYWQPGDDLPWEQGNWGADFP